MIADWISKPDTVAHRIVAGATLVLGLLLGALPLMLILPVAAFWSTLLTGAVLVFLGAWQLWATHEVADRLLVLAALWLGVSPWATGAGYPAWLSALHVVAAMALIGWTGLRLRTGRSAGCSTGGTQPV